MACNARPMRTFLVACIGAASLLFTPMDSLAQDIDVSGTAWVTDWPTERPAPEGAIKPPPLDYSAYTLLPFIDELDVHYWFEGTATDPVAPGMHFEIEWWPANGGVVDGRRVSRSQMPDDIVIESIELMMDVIVDDRVVADFFLPLDTINLGPTPSLTIVDVTDVAWDSVFVDVGVEESKRIFQSGFRLSSPRILRVVFVVAPEAFGASGIGGDRRRVYEPRYRTVVIPDFEIWLAWNDGGHRDWRRPGRGEVATSEDSARPEVRRSPSDRGRGRRGLARADGSRSPRSGSQRSGEADDSEAGRANGTDDNDDHRDKGDDSDDDDDDRLYPAALAGAVAVGAVAIAGGTVGYYGSTSVAPIGLVSGFVRPHGGALLHVAINRQVFGEAAGPENLVAGFTAFYDVVGIPLQPSVGFGLRATEAGSDTYTTNPTFTLGVVGNFGRIVLLAGYDVLTPDVYLGTAVNFRHH